MGALFSKSDAEHVRAVKLPPPPITVVVTPLVKSSPLGLTFALSGMEDVAFARDVEGIYKKKNICHNVLINQSINQIDQMTVLAQTKVTKKRNKIIQEPVAQWMS